MSRKLLTVARTVELYEGLLRRHIKPYFGGVTLAMIDNKPARIRAWRGELLEAGVSVSVAAKAYRLLRAVLHTALDDDLIGRNPCRIRGADQEHAAERPTLTPAQVAELTRRMPPRLVALVPLLRQHLADYVGDEPDAPIFTGAKGARLRRNDFGKLVGWSSGGGRRCSWPALPRPSAHGQRARGKGSGDHDPRPDGTHGTRLDPCRAHLPARCSGRRPRHRRRNANRAAVSVDLEGIRCGSAHPASLYVACSRTAVCERGSRELRARLRDRASGATGPSARSSSDRRPERGRQRLPHPGQPPRPGNAVQRRCRT